MSLPSMSLVRNVMRSVRGDVFMENILIKENRRFKQVMKDMADLKEVEIQEEVSSGKEGQENRLG